MPALVEPTGTQILDALTISDGMANQFGRWTAAAIDFHIANSLVNVVGAEYDYAVAILLEAGIVAASLTAAQYPIATQAMLYAIGYRLLKLDLESSVNMPVEPNLGINRAEMNTKMNNYFKLAGLEWQKLSIDSQYYQAATVGFSDTAFVQNIDPYAYPNIY